jgi:hypothetical protein
MTEYERFICLPITKAEDGTFGLGGIHASADLKGNDEFILSVLRYATFLLEKQLYEKNVKND